MYVWSSVLRRCELADPTFRLPVAKAGKVRIEGPKVCPKFKASDPDKFFTGTLKRALNYAGTTQSSTGCEVSEIVVHGMLPVNISSKVLPAKAQIKHLEDQLQVLLTEMSGKSGRLLA